MADVRLIDADALNDEFEAECAGDCGCCRHQTFCSTGFRCKLIAKAPTIDAVPVVHGRWVRFVEDLRHHIEYDMCSGCGFKYGGIGVEHFRYCPNCGAKMDGGAEG